MEAWIAHQQYIRRFNMLMAGLYIAAITTAWLIGGPRLAGVVFLVGLVAGGLVIGLANVALHLGTPPVDATEAEIRATAATGPKWLKRLVVKFDAERQ
ncbi:MULTISPECIES: hypothetical protein [unclassified Pseudomonas]|uniref:hypothetical protein n=1 Tax=unclassified Pseudomonas TaxID=196821 RepID=UPI001CBF4EC6|nr:MULTISPECIES: hypothetical protein [unclassified Pseudomonas]